MCYINCMLPIKILPFTSPPCWRLSLAHSICLLNDISPSTQVKYANGRMVMNEELKIIWMQAMVVCLKSSLGRNSNRIAHMTFEAEVALITVASFVDVLASGPVSLWRKQFAHAFLTYVKLSFIYMCIFYYLFVFVFLSFFSFYSSFFVHSYFFL